jgi:hypothetical protein
MTEKEIKEYRSLIETQLKEKESDIENTITYINIGLLGFFLTINEKFIPLISSQYKWILAISIFSFLASFILGLINKYKTTEFDRKIIEIIDCRDLKNEQDEQYLFDKWKEYDTTLRNIRNIIYLFLSIGLITQLIYFFINLSKDLPEDKNIKIEVTIRNIDTIIKHNNIYLKIQNVKKIKK